ncbi:MAG: hypothetical protein H7Z40_18350 [Phycisphaerae bacterium]|nr:hypothetical protein [Gemmatimonadaceae bacterium]
MNAIHQVRATPGRFPELIHHSVRPQTGGLERRAAQISVHRETGGIAQPLAATAT